ncbi:MAG TPA: M50 family metallopeptidase [Gaiellaceae bacterium]
MTYLIVVLGLLLLIFLHELGHFTAARAVGIKPRKFYVGFPPALAKVRRNGVEYGIGAIPLGGYVRIPGMHRPAARDFEAWMRPAINEDADLLPPSQRIRRELEAENFAGARADLPELQQLLAQAQLTSGARRISERAVREVEEGTGDDAYWRQPTWKRLVVIAAGPLANVIVAFVIFFAMYASGAPTGPATTTVADVDPSLPAAAAGLRAGDKVLSVNGVHTKTFAAVSRRVRASHGGPVTMTVERDGHVVKLGPRDTVRSSDRWIWGFVPSAELQSHPVGESFGWAAHACWAITTGTGRALGGLFHSSERKQLTGTLGIVRESAAQLRVGLPYYLQILGIVSMSLALLNLLPLLPLDGGHIVVSLIESVRRRALAREVYERVSIFGLAIVLFIAFIALNNDLSRGG